MGSQGGAGRVLGREAGDAFTHPRCHLRAPPGWVPAAARPGLGTNRGCLRTAGSPPPPPPHAEWGGEEAGSAPGDPSTHGVGPPWAGEDAVAAAALPRGCPLIPRDAQSGPPLRPAAPERPRPRSGAIRGECVHEFLLLEIKFRVGSVLGKGVFL